VRGGRRPAGRSNVVSWFNRRFGPEPPFTGAGEKASVFDWLTRAPEHRVVRYEVPLPGVGERPWRVALLADLHLGSQSRDIERLGRIVAQTNALAPDLVLLLGDYVNMMPFFGDRIPPERIAAVLAGLTPPAGTFAVLGNHDWRYGREAVSNALEGAGASVIDNRIAAAQRAGETLMLLGLEDDRRGEPDVALFAQLPAGRPALVVTHDPGLFHDAPWGSVMVAGHMHGGQIRWPALPAPVVPSGRAPRRWANGHIRENGGDLIVSAGLGVSGLPLRVGIPPEIVIVTLVQPGLA
jgi:predicted MPP superfamily phosphohydrolase